ncbi:MAG: TonB-dependent receptor [Hyphomicrobiaceae bacterium]
MTYKKFRIACLAGTFGVAPGVAIAQQPAPTLPAPPAQTAPATGIKVPEVQVIQPAPVKPKPVVPQQAAPKPKAAPVQTTTPAPKPAPVKQAAPKPKPALVVAAPPVVVPQPESVAQVVEPGSQVKLSPIGGEIPIEKYSGAVSTVSSANITSSGSNNTTDALQQRVPGVAIVDVAGNSFQQEVNFRGFSAAPNNGVAQGLAVYQNGVRINEIFGDTVNWDQVPSVAVSDIAVVTGNPVFGLNAIGGAVLVTMKDGFSYQGTEIDARFGSFGRRQGSLQHGAQYGNFATYVAIEGVKDDGWRDHSDSTVRRAYADLGFKNSQTEMHLNFTGSSNFFGAAAATPLDLVNQRYGSVFTTPQTIKNKMGMLSFNASQMVSNTLKVSGNVYYRKFKQKRVDGNVSDVVDCDITANDPSGLCFDEFDNDLIGTGGLGGTSGNPGGIWGSLDRTAVDADGIGGQVQAVEKSKVLGLGNQLLVGASVDTGRLTSTAASELGKIDPNTFIVNGQGIILTSTEIPVAIQPVNLAVSTNYYGLFLSDTLDLTDRLSLTLGARYNIAQINLRDKTGSSPDLNGNNRYERFNPMIGGAYRLTPNATLFGGYSEANRAPTPAELACADPDKPCLLEGFLVADPPLKQVVSHTFEGGMRGNFGVNPTGGKLDWSIALYRAENDDDIISVSSPTQGRGYFQNAGSTRRQGLDLAVSYRDDRFSFYSGYGYVDATFQSDINLPSPNNPRSADLIGTCADGSDGCILVRPGDKLTGVPAHRFKAGFEYMITSQWLFGADVVAVSDQFFRGDEDNKNTKMPGYGTVNLHTSYNVTKNLQFYGLVNNVFDAKYSLGGTYYNSGDLNDLTGSAFTDNRTVIPGAPLAAYGGVKLKF